MQVIYEDNHLIVVNKPAGLLVQGDKTEDATLGDWLKKYIKDRYKKETWTNPMSLDILRHDLEEYDLEYNKWFLIKDLVYAFLLN